MSICVDTELLRSIGGLEKKHISACMNCGVCTGTCPMDIGLLPRQVFRHVLLGMRERLVEDMPAIFSCLLCRMCEQSCPAEVPIAENIRLLRSHFNKSVHGIER